MATYSIAIKCLVIIHQIMAMTSVLQTNKGSCIISTQVSTNIRKDPFFKKNNLSGKTNVLFPKFLCL